MAFVIGDDESVSEAIILAVSSAKQCDPCSMEPLYESIDPNALDLLFPPLSDGTGQTECRISFTYSGYSVTVASRESITVQPAKKNTLRD